MSGHEVRPGSCLPLPQCRPSASPSKRGDPGASVCHLLIRAEAGAALLPGIVSGREDNLLPTALLSRTLAPGSETGGIGKPLILLLAALVWREQGDCGGRAARPSAAAAGTGRAGTLACRAAAASACCAPCLGAASSLALRWLCL